MEISIRENVGCYASQAQQQLLADISKIEVIEKNFFLTGGTGLSVFYLHHRVSEDLDLFATEFNELDSIDIVLKRTFKRELTLIQSSREFLSYLINNTKVDFVFDPLSLRGERPRVHIESGETIQIDRIENIASNKLCAITSRSEPKDLVDFYFISHVGWKGSEEAGFLNCYNEAKKKEALLDDPAMAAYQLEELLKRVLAERENALPRMRKEIDWVVFEDTYKNFVDIMYRMEHWS